ncbi:YhcN/YlaJ family sporulation lipoprotein [Virgibacillus necropolis]|uniref:YhcN/YlaJ family sporulation lipoprotein n=1 Tax=Virgibacillus necropolis TaxID=163877 RepID=UPI00384D7153
MKIKTLGIALLASAALVGCQNQDENNETAPNDTNVEQTRFNAGDGNNMNDQENRQDFDMNEAGNENGDNNNKYDLSEKAAEKITQQIKGIESANVVTTENNAYVAAELDANDNGANINNTGTGNGDDNKNANNGNGNKNNNANGNNNNSENGDEITDEVKQKISDIVKSVDKDVDNVYVSTNPDFGDLVTKYADQAENGEPIEGLFDQMGNMIERVFPQDKE